jgi:uncharacterized protein (TIGR02679 family)
VSDTDEKLRAIFSAPGWLRFIDMLVQYRDRGQPLPAVVTLSAPSADERRLHARLLRLSMPSTADPLRYELAKIAAALQGAQLPAEWTEILTIVRGPIASEKLAAQAIRLNWKGFWPQTAATLDRHPFAANCEWLESLRRDGTLRRLTKGDATFAAQLVQRATRLLQALPLREDQPLASVASRYGGNSHALDPGTVLSTLILRGLALQLGRVTPSRSDERRDLWGAFGVVCDELSAPALSFNLALGGDALLPRLVALASTETQPLHLTSRLLWATDWGQITCPPTVWVCENPTIVALAATQLGQRCPPLVCVEGEPKPAGRLLLRRLRAGGSALLYHGDFDWAGVAIAARIFQEFGAEPWCFDADSYRLAAARQGRPLTGKPTLTPWSPPLAEAMEHAGVAYDEELIADALLSDLRQAFSGS